MRRIIGAAFTFPSTMPGPVMSTGDGYQLQDGAPVDDLADNEPLAWAGRASASYPVAFAPVRETPQLRERRVWPDWETSDKPDWLADGGILDNSPFDPVLESIQHKAVTGPWKRTLCFVVPSGAEAVLGRDITRPAPGGAGGQPAEPPPWTSVAAAAFGFPREANFRDDIDHLHGTIRCGRSSFDVSRFLLLTGMFLALPVPRRHRSLGSYFLRPETSAPPCSRSTGSRAGSGDLPGAGHDRARAS